MQLGGEGRPGGNDLVKMQIKKKYKDIKVGGREKNYSIPFYPSTLLPVFHSLYPKVVSSLDLQRELGFEVSPQIDCASLTK